MKGLGFVAVIGNELQEFKPVIYRGVNIQRIYAPNEALAFCAHDTLKLPVKLHLMLICLVCILYVRVLGINAFLQWHIFVTGIYAVWVIWGNEPIHNGAWLNTDMYIECTPKVCISSFLLNSRM